GTHGGGAFHRDLRRHGCSQFGRRPFWTIRREWLVHFQRHHVPECDRRNQRGREHFVSDRQWRIDLLRRTVPPRRGSTPCRILRDRPGGDRRSVPRSGCLHRHHGADRGRLGLGNPRNKRMVRQQRDGLLGGGRRNEWRVHTLLPNRRIRLDNLLRRLPAHRWPPSRRILRHGRRGP